MAAPWWGYLSSYAGDWSSLGRSEQSVGTTWDNTIVRLDASKLGPAGVYVNMSLSGLCPLALDVIRVRMGDHYG